LKLLNKKLNLLKNDIDLGKPIFVMIIGLGSVGNHLLNYLISLSDSKINIVVIGRNEEKLIKDVNIAKVAGSIRGQLHSSIKIDICDLDNIYEIERVISKYNPHFIVNTSRVYSGFKYGSISWHNLRAYGIWTPLSVKYIRNIMIAYRNISSEAIVINTSYSDAVNPWIKSAGLAYPDFGSGNLTHLIPRIKFVIAEEFNISNLNDIDITLATSHFHNVVISKEGHDEGIEQLFVAKFRGKILNMAKKKIFESCTISMPNDHRRNMMNASSNFEIITKIITSLRDKVVMKFHSPGFNGSIGGYPVIIDSSKEEVSIDYDTTDFSVKEMESSNIESINLDGIDEIKGGDLIYTNKLVKDVNSIFNVKLPNKIAFKDIDKVATLLIEKIIKPNSNN
jgi:hypothetical protein